MRRGWQRGVLEGSSAWTVVGGVALIVHLARRARRRDPDVVFSEKLRPDEVLRIRHVVPPGR
jgi:hypothetical protein